MVSLYLSLSLNDTIIDKPKLRIYIACRIEQFTCSDRMMEINILVHLYSRTLRLLLQWAFDINATEDYIDLDVLNYAIHDHATIQNAYHTRRI